jgi:hypothetical protein
MLGMPGIKEISIENLTFEALNVKGHRACEREMEGMVNGKTG